MPPPWSGGCFSQSIIFVGSLDVVLAAACVCGGACANATGTQASATQTIERTPMV
jgi:hypothetical protein